jgi:hypothetical protein
MVVWQATALVSADILDTEDSGMAKIIQISDDDGMADEGFFVRLHSWYEWKKLGNEEIPPFHPLIAQLFGKRVRVTVEILEFDDNG